MKINTHNGPTCAVLMSGGVDSSVAAIKLIEAGHRPIGVTLLMAPSSSPDSPAVKMAKDTAKMLHMEHLVLDVRDLFEREVLRPFREQYAAGRTPNPCSDCNRGVKLGGVADILDRTEGLKGLPIATGHYARIEREGPLGAVRLKTAEDKKRDQSYFLADVPRRVLARLIFPLGNAPSKDEVRKAAEAAGLPAAREEDSMDVCFAQSGRYEEILGEEAFQEGPIVDKDGNQIGRHRGVGLFTVGQRKGLGVSSAAPLYVKAIIPPKVVAAPREDIMWPLVSAGRCNLLTDLKIEPGLRLFGKTRSQGDPKPCQAVSFEEDRITVLFDEPVFAPCPGQRLVLYDADGAVVLGGTITG
ncbi:MAG: tRNA 2-thiouridine(34) synthase MnmA [Thermanaerothrix sp.]|nr:tRNA 2-thiouridine(34) synthase MnmA [Thermanaerothrix sp.]